MTTQIAYMKLERDIELVFKYLIQITVGYTAKPGNI